MCDCLRKQLYLHFVGNIIVIQLLRVSPAARAKGLLPKLTLLFSNILFSGALPMGPGFARPRAPEPFGGFSKKKLAAAFHPRVLFNRTTGYSRPHKRIASQLIKGSIVWTFGFLYKR